MGHELVLEQQCDQQGVPQDSFVIKQMTGARVIGTQMSDRTASLGSVLSGADVDQMISGGYRITMTLGNKSPLV